MEPRVRSPQERVPACAHQDTFKHSKLAVHDIQKFFVHLIAPKPGVENKSVISERSPLVSESVNRQLKYRRMERS